MLKWSCKKIFAGIVIISLAGSIFPIMPTFSAENFPSYYERTPSEREGTLLTARDFAYQYLKNSSEEPLWKNKFPYISKEKFFYTANDKIPSYIEFKVSTSENHDAGFIVVNIDGNDVQVPIASPNGKTPSEALNIRFDKNHGKSENEKLYYFSPFDQWMVDENGNAETLNPNNQEDKIIETEKSENNFENNSEISLRSAENKNNKEKILTEEWKQKQNTKFVEMKKNAVEFVNSGEVRSVRNIETRSARYVNPGSSNIFLPWYKNRNDGCNGPLPCYDQFKTGWFWWCNSGCGATAIAIVLWYYDWNGYGRLYVPWYAPSLNNTNINSIIKDIRNNIDTTCGGESNTLNWDKWLKLIKDKWYNYSCNSQLAYASWDVYYAVKSEIDNKRPLIVAFTGVDGWHFGVASGYSSQTLNVVRLNMGWWLNTSNGYNSSNVDMNLSSVYYNWKNNLAHGAIQIKIWQ